MQVGHALLNVPQGPVALQHALWRVHGPQALSFLQRRSCNEVASLPSLQGCGNALLDKKAYLYAPFSLHHWGEDDLLALVPAAASEAFEREVLKYKLLDDFTLEAITPQWEALLCVGANPFEGLAANACQLLAPLNQGGGAWWLQSPFFLLGRQAGWGGVLLYPKSSSGASSDGAFASPTQALEDLLPQHPQLLHPLRPSAYETVRLNLGLPLWGVDMQDTTQLPELGLEHWLVSYTKGCYLGQETVARVKTYGGIAQTLMPITLQVPASLPTSARSFTQGPLKLEPDGGDIGHVTSLQWSSEGTSAVGLAYVKRAHRSPKQGVPALWHGHAVALSTQLQAPWLQAAASTQQQQEAQLALATRLYMEGTPERIAEAFSLLRQAIAADAAHYAAYETLAVLLSRENQVAEAIAVLEALLEANPNWVMAYTNLSIAHLKLGDKDKAEYYKAEATKTAMRLKVEASLAAKGLSSPSNRAETAAEEAPPTLSEAQRQSLLERRALLQHALTFAPTDALAHFGLAGVAEALGEVETAMAAYRQAIAGNAQHTQSYLALAKLLHGAWVATPLPALKEELNAVLESGMAVAAKRGDLQPLTQLQALQQALLEHTANHTLG